MIFGMGWKGLKTWLKHGGSKVLRHGPKMHGAKWIMKENHGMMEEHHEKGRPKWI